MISVCIATHNGAKYIKEQIDSILSQIGPDDEIIISDDGSIDATIDIIRSYHDARINVYYYDSSTISTTFPLDKPTHNFENALSKAKGDIIFLSDQDDIWMEGKVEAMVDALKDHHLAIHDCMVVNSDCQTVIQPSYFNHIGIHQGVWNNLIRATYLGCCMAMRRCVMEKALPFPKTMVAHDIWLGIIADRYFTTTLVRKKLIQYRKHINSTTTSGEKSKNSLLFKIRYRITILKHIIS